MQVVDDSLFKTVVKTLLDPLFKYNPFFTLYYNPFSQRPEIPRKKYINYLHQVALVLSVIPRRRVRLLIGDEVGLGKTIEAIRLVKYMVTTGEARRVLIIAPRSLIKQWLHHEIRDLMYAPHVVRVLSRKNIDELKETLPRMSSKPLILLAPLDLVKRGSEDQHRSGPYRPYYDLVSSIDWDLIIIDEAHHIGFTRGRLSLRTKRLAPLCSRARHLVLLSATPSRGTHRDMLGRISLLVPEAGDYIKSLEKNIGKRQEFYKTIQDCLVLRRAKEHVNQLEGRRVFRNLYSYMALVKLRDEYRRLYEDLGNLVGLILRYIDTESKDVSSILKVIVVKRALSSPYAFLKTLLRVIEHRTESSELYKIKLYEIKSIYQRVN